jgi:hypothetical protein
VILNNLRSRRKERGGVVEYSVRSFSFAARAASDAGRIDGYGKNILQRRQVGGLAKGGHRLRVPLQK